MYPNKKDWTLRIVASWKYIGKLETVECDLCSGSGQIQQNNGWGFDYDQCDQCHGSGKIKRKPLEQETPPIPEKVINEIRALLDREDLYD